MKNFCVRAFGAELLKAVFAAVFAFALLTAVTGPAAAKTPLSVYWDDGLRIQSQDATADIKIGGRVQVDGGWAWGNDRLETVSGPVADGVEIRRLRLHAAAVLYKHAEGKIEVDFAANKAEIRDAFIGLLGGPAGSGLRVGFFKEPFSLEQLTSDRYVSLAERALTDVFAPGRATGVMAYANKLVDEKVTVAAGAFRPTLGTSADGGYDFAGRITFAPLLERGGERLVHLGVAGVWREDPQDRGNDTIEFRQRPEYHNTSYLLGTGTVPAKSLGLLETEVAVNIGPLSVQGEYMWAKVQGDPAASGNEPLFRGFYVMTSIFMTGEHRSYKAGIFTRASPKTTAFISGTGAIELAIRYSNLDLQDLADGTAASSAAGVSIGDAFNAKAQAVAVGLNWYLNPNVQWRFNYVRADFNGAPNTGTQTLPASVRLASNGGGAVSVFVTRLQLDL